MRCLIVSLSMPKLLQYTALLLLILLVRNTRVAGFYFDFETTKGCEIECTSCECKTFANSITDEFICRCHDLIENKTYYYPISEIPANNLTGPVRFFMGDTSDGRVVSKTECPKQPGFEILAMAPKPTNATQPEFIQFNSFNFDGDRMYRISPWLENIRDYLEGIHVMCGTMRTVRRGMFQGFSNLHALSIVQTGLQNVAAGAFAELGSVKLKELFIIGNPMQSFDWSVLEPVASGLRSVWIERNEINEMTVSSPVSFPALYVVFLESNRLRSISADVVATWPEKSLQVELVYNPLCPRDSLCRCCSLVPLFQFAQRTSSEVRVFCGHSETLNYCESTPVHRTPKCTSPCVKDGNLTDMVQLSDYDNCGDFDEDTMSCEDVP